MKKILLIMMIACSAYGLDSTRPTLEFVMFTSSLTKIGTTASEVAINGISAKRHDDEGLFQPHVVTCSKDYSIIWITTDTVQDASYIQFIEINKLGYNTKRLTLYLDKNGKIQQSIQKFKEYPKDMYEIIKSTS